MSELLIEIYSEEIPARMQLQAAADFKELWIKALTEKNADFTDINTYVAPQRLAACITGLKGHTRGSEEVRRGPKISAPEVALAGFLKSTGKTKDQLIQKDDYWYAELSQEGKPIQELLPEILNEVMDKLPWPKTMRWYNHQTKQMSKPWIRPIRSILCVYDGKPVAFNVPDFGINTGNITFGHRFLAPEAITVKGFDDYKQQLAKAFVILDHQKRQEMIKELITEQTAAKRLTLKEDQGLLEEVAGLVDYPFAHLGKIEESFMHLPGVVMSTSMRVHQKYFTVVDKDGQIAPFFGVITNVPAKPDNRLMLDGLERVLRARLADAAFFYDEDMKHHLIGQGLKLSHIVFHEKLGSLNQKIARMEAVLVSRDEKRAAFLSKCDLSTGMVGEFPELQGIMGEIYATAKGEKPEVAAALREYYLPQGPSDPCPTASISVNLALVDKLDTLLGFIGVGLKPTGSKDPFGLRRAALGVIRLQIENRLINRKDIESTLSDLRLQYKLMHSGLNEPSLKLQRLSPTAVEDTMQFIYDRLTVYLRTQGIYHDCVAAVLNDRSSCLWSISERAKALQSFLKTDPGIALRAAYKRAAGILSKGSFHGGVNKVLLKEEAEKQLFSSLSALEQEYQTLFTEHRYEEVMNLLASLRKPIDAFFDTVTVNVDDEKLKENRYALLNHFISLVNQIADFSKLQG